MIKPFIKYPGGKLKEFHFISQYAPKEISRYFEPFVGGGSVFFNMNVENSFINDKSKDLINIYNYVKYQNNDFFLYLTELDMLWREIEFVENLPANLFNINEIDYFRYQKQSLLLKNRKFAALEQVGAKISSTDKKELLLTAKKTALYMCVRDLYNKRTDDMPLHTACFYFIREFCYSSMFRFSKNGTFNVPYGGRSYNYKNMSSKIEQMQSNDIIKYVKNTSIYNLDFEDFICKFDMDSSDFMFLDPPYDSDFSTYDNNVFDKNEQVRLRNLLKQSFAKWMLVIKKTDFICDLYSDFYMYEYDKNYMVSFKNRNNKGAKHLLITNYSIED